MIWVVEKREPNSPNSRNAEHKTATVALWRGDNAY